MNAIEVRDLHKRYRRPQTEVPRRLRNLKHLLSRTTSWALRDVSFDVPVGSSLALIGANGSGKSSLLRILAGTSRQTAGTVVVREPTYGLLTLGEGMHPLLTGRENAVTGAMLSGLSHPEAVAAVPAIAEFSGLADALDRPFRTYSDGMRLRLAFATSMVVEPRILLIDEVLAVGDLRFRERCLAHLRALQERGVTTVFVSHDLDQVRRLCDRALWLADGRVVRMGQAEAVIDEYEERMFASLRGDGEEVAEGGATRTGTREIEITDVRLRTSAGLSTHLRAGAAVSVEVDYHAPKPTQGAVLTVGMSDADGVHCLEVSTEGDKVALPDLSGRGTLTLDLERIDLSPGLYSVDVGLYPPDWSRTFDYWWRKLEFEVHGPVSKGVVSPPRSWGHRSPSDPS